MRIVITKGATGDRVAVTRTDGSCADFGFPRKGAYPHDAFHFFVERELGMTTGFWGLVARGMAPEAVQELAAAGGHASAKRARRPDPEIVELVQAERLVECFEAASWNGGADDAGIMAMAGPAWIASFVPPPRGVPERLGAIRAALDPFLEAWRRLPDGGSLELEWLASVGENA